MSNPNNENNASDTDIKVNTTENHATNKDDSDSNSIHNIKFNLANFEITKILNSNAMKKVMFIQGTFKERPEPAIVILEKENFPEEAILQTKFFHNDTDIVKTFHNDIYGNYECFAAKECNGIKTLIIHPATKKHIDKFTAKPCYIVDETYELYKNVTLPYIIESEFSLQWVDNIFEHKAEFEKIIYEDPDNETGFIILPDLKWDGDIQSLSILILVKKKIRSLRELDSSHLPLLKKIKEKGPLVIQEKYGIIPSCIRMYLHYQPSYYQLHVHCSFLMQQESSGINAERAHILTTVISNIEIDSNYYQKATLPFVVFKGQPLYEKFQELNMLPDDNTTKNFANKTDNSQCK